MATREELRSFLDGFYNLLGEVSGGRESILRFNVPYLSVSEISQQYYCERKVEMARVLGKIEKEHEIIGREAHEILQRDAEKTGKEAMFREIFSGEDIFCYEMLLLAIIGGIVIAGRPDVVFLF